MINILIKLIKNIDNLFMGFNVIQILFLYPSKQYRNKR